MKTQATVQQQPAASTGSPLVQVSGALTAIIVFILFAAWVAKRFSFAQKTGSSKELKVSASCSVGPRERVVIVDVQDARLVLGITAGQITHLHTLPAAAVSENASPTPPPADFQGLMKNLLKRNGKD
ncbi:flagellar type III secretion system protein FliO [Buttiauxella warmboldiae]|uniref:Flagellar protein n=1 Tax=Buttiauxella warmboldiae TaxID=82993 RepID=A0A3N5D314_9ENTR|nr:flagellar biosynthetic protein FliO [Buttiauxella warmboldiae]RPH21562.1 flagellar type III secretion system protein FliO [Buttiauxella warmboldiae]